MSGHVNIGKLLSACVDVCQKAGGIIRSVQKQGDLKIQYKGVDDMLTQADLAAQQLIVGALKSIWPAIHMVAEEKIECPPSAANLDEELVKDVFVPPEFRSVPQQDIVIYVDPVDATREFTQGKLECVVTLLGICLAGKPIAGVIHQPFHGADGRTIYGIVGSGVKGLTKVSRSSPGVVLTTSASHHSPIIDRAIDKIRPDSVMKVGGAGFKSLLLMEEIADVYVYPTGGCKLWDVAGPHALISAIGGKITDPWGAPIQYGPQIDVRLEKGLLASIRDHDRYLHLLRDLK